MCNPLNWACIWEGNTGADSFQMHNLRFRACRYHQEKLREVWPVSYSWSLTMWLAILNFKIDTKPRRWQISVLTRIRYGYVVPTVFMPSGRWGERCVGWSLQTPLFPINLDIAPVKMLLFCQKAFSWEEKKSWVSSTLTWVKVKVDHCTSNFNPLSGLVNL